MMKTNKWGVAAIAGGAALVLAGCAGGGSGDSPDQSLTVLIAASGDAEADAVNAAAAAFTEQSGIDVDVVLANNLNEQLSQGFAGDDPPDLFYMGWDQFQTYAGNGYLEPYAGDLSNAGDFFPGLVDTFSYDGEFVCAPKDFSTLGLIINTDLWAAAGLTDADIPTDWDSLTAAATALTTPETVGLSFGLEYARLGVFMNQAGGTIVDGDQITADSAENLEGLEYVRSLYDAGVLRFPSEIDAGWGGEALGAGKAAMVIEGPWIKGIAGDFPDTNYAAYELPAGPGGPSTYSFTNCWGLPQGADTTDAAVEFVEFLTSDEQQVEFGDAFGVIPSTQEAAATYAEKYPENAAFVAGADYAVSPANFDGSAAVVAEFNARLADFGNADFAAILADFQAQLEAAYAEANG
jgi:multiple sugar transport system substrate-binding protein